VPTDPVLLDDLTLEQSSTLTRNSPAAGDFR
jgi:hypothetical protein